MMKMMLVGSDRVYAIENMYVKYMREAGVDVEVFAAASMFYDYYEQGILQKLIYRAHLSGIDRKINQRFKEVVEAFQPEIIWVFKGMEISPSSLAWAKKRGIKLVNYNPDNPFIFTGKGSGNKNVRDSISLYDLHFTYNLEVLDELTRRYKVKTAYLPFGFDISDKLYAECAAQEEINKLCFLGNPDKQRSAFLKEILDQGVAIDIFGNAWDKFISGPGVTVHPPVYGDKLWMVLRRYRAQLNMMRIHNEQSHNMRTFEVPGVGGIMIAPQTREHEMFFENGKEVFLYRSPGECVEMIRHVLSMPVNDALAIRNKAREVSLEKGYHYRNRAMTALDSIRQM